MITNILFLTKIASCCSAKQYTELDNLLTALSGVNPAKIYEVILQLYLFNGFPATIESLKVFKVHFPDFQPNNEKYNVNLFQKRGIINCKSVYTNNYDKLQINIAKLSPDLAEWMIIEGYGKVMGRSGLSMQERELINVAMLCTNFSEHQLHSHMKGSLNTGSSKKFIREVIESTKDYNSQSNIDNTLEMLDIVTSE